MSSIIISWVTSTNAPHPSVTLYVLVIVSGHVNPSEASPTCVTAGGVVKSSASSVTTFVFTAGTSPEH